MCDDEEESSAISLGVLMAAGLVTAMVFGGIAGCKEIKKNRAKNEVEEKKLEQRIADSRETLKEKMFKLEKNKARLQNTTARLSNVYAANYDAKDTSTLAMDKGVQLYLREEILPRARVMQINPENIILKYNKDEFKVNYYPIQQVVFNNGSLTTQDDIIALVTQTTLPIAQGVMYKVHYTPIKEGNVLTETALYNYISQGTASYNKALLKNNFPLYNRKMPNIKGIIEKIEVAK
jgi:hypothetical protein